jgi:hypothetical protein
VLDDYIWDFDTHPAPTRIRLSGVAIDLQANTIANFDITFSGFENVVGTDLYDSFLAMTDRICLTRSEAVGTPGR